MKLSFGVLLLVLVINDYQAEISVCGYYAEGANGKSVIHAFLNKVKIEEGKPEEPKFDCDPHNLAEYETEDQKKELSDKIYLFYGLTTSDEAKKAFNDKIADLETKSAGLENDDLKLAKDKITKIKDAEGLVIRPEEEAIHILNCKVSNLHKRLLVKEGEEKAKLLDDDFLQDLFCIFLTDVEKEISEWKAPKKSCAPFKPDLTDHKRLFGIGAQRLLTLTSNSKSIVNLEANTDSNPTARTVFGTRSLYKDSKIVIN